MAIQTFRKPPEKSPLVVAYIENCRAEDQPYGMVAWSAYSCVGFCMTKNKKRIGASFGGSAEDVRAFAAALLELADSVDNHIYPGSVLGSNFEYQ